MRRRTTWGIGGLGLVVVLTTGWLVFAQPPGSPPPPEPAAPTVSAGVVAPAGIPTPPPVPNLQPRQTSNLQPPTPATAPVAPQPVPTAVTPPPKANGDLVQELIQIINETRSVDTFFVTTKLLENMGGKSRQAVPAIIRNAERLELFKDAFLQTEKDGDKQKRMELATLIVDSLDKIMNAAPGGSAARQPAITVPAPLSPPATKRDLADPLVTPTSGRLSGPPFVTGSPAVRDLPPTKEDGRR